MSTAIFSKINQLEQKIQKLIEENFEYQQKIANFEIILKEKTAQLDKCAEQNKSLLVEIEQFKLGSAFAGTNEDNSAAKLKIDSLIKEINLCIAALKE